jgi:hypothetical protein
MRVIYAWLGQQGDNMKNTNNQPLMGSRPANATARKIEGGDAWKDTPYFGAGLEADSEHMKAFPIGAELIGVVRAIRTTKAEKEADRKRYACLEAQDGTKFRVSAPGQLVFLLEEAGIGTLVQIIYRGKEVVEGYKQPLHQFEVNALEVLQ